MIEGHSDVIARVVNSSSVMFLGAMDTGKTTMALACARAAVDAGKTVGFVDADISNSRVGPPACVGLKYLRTSSDFDRIEEADALHFVGAISPNKLVLQQVIATAALAGQAGPECDLVVIDTSSVISGVIGETLKYHKAELVRPDEVVVMQRGAEMEPISGMLKRFFSAEVTSIAVDPDLMPSSPDERAERRTEAFRKAFAPELGRWRVRSTVFAPTLPPALEQSRLHGMLVGVQDGHGGCLGLGRLEYDDGALRVSTNTGEGMQGLRIGSLSIDPETFVVTPVNLRDLMFGVR
jgi:polynucleotide 5'-kinase involved in rRNA processing